MNQFEPLEKCSGNVKEDYRDEGETSNAAEHSECAREKLQMRLNIVNVIWKRFFEFSKFTGEVNKRERCNLTDD